MTNENKKANIEAEWERALASLRSAGILFDAGEYNDSMSRAYYAVFHAARVLLLTLGLEPTSHRGVNYLMNLHFIKQGTLERSMGRLMSRMQKFREEADYNRFFVFDREGTEEELKAAKGFIGLVEGILRQDGWLPQGSSDPPSKP